MPFRGSARRLAERAPAIWKRDDDPSPPSSREPAVARPRVITGVSVANR